MGISRKLILPASEPLLSLLERYFEVSTSELPSAFKLSIDEALREFLSENEAIETQLESADLLVGRVVVHLSEVLWQSLFAFSVCLVARFRSDPLLWDATVLLALLRSLSNAFTRLDKASGEVCVYMASLALEHHPVFKLPIVPNIDDLKIAMFCPIEGDDAVRCKYSEGSKCRITREDVVVIVERLKDAGAFRRH